jgi:cation diffusion facilitator CzcD-associated flavoprotein CzcO
MAAPLSEAAGASSPSAGVETLDVVVVGAGLSGICAARYLQRECAGLDFAVLEARDTVGGTWDLFRYPACVRIRTCTRLPTPSGPGSARTRSPTARTSSTTCAPLRATRHRAAISASAIAWSRELGQRQRALDAHGRARGNGSETLLCRFLMMCSGYYDYAQGHRPDFEGEESFQGPIVHPQSWPESLELAGKRVLVIGSGATAMSLVPALAEQAAHVCMVQRSPTWVICAAGARLAVP